MAFHISQLSCIYTHLYNMVYILIVFHTIALAEKYPPPPPLHPGEGQSLGQGQGQNWGAILVGCNCPRNILIYMLRSNTFFVLRNDHLHFLYTFQIKSSFMIKSILIHEYQRKSKRINTSQHESNTSQHGSKRV